MEPHIYLIAGVAFAIGLLVGGTAVFVYPETAYNRAIKSPKDENESLQKINALHEQRAKEFLEVLRQSE